MRTHFKSEYASTQHRKAAYRMLHSYDDEYGAMHTSCTQFCCSFVYSVLPLNCSGEASSGLYLCSKQ